jgi:hypothetical protein
MPVTDLTDSLPWWVQQGAGGPQPGAGGAPQGASWLQYLSQMYGISPAQAATMIQGQGGNPANMPSANASNMMAAAPAGPLSGDFPVPPGAVPPIQPQMGRVSQASPIDQLKAGGTGGNVPNIPIGPGLVPPIPQAPGYLGSSGAGSGDPRAQDAAMNRIAGMAGGVVNPGYRPPGITPGTVNPNVPAATAQPVSGPLANPGGAGGVGAASNPRFVMIDRPNAPAGGSPYGRGGPPQMSALNLAGLFGGGPQGGPAAAPMGGPVRGPLASGNISMDDLYPAAAAARGSISMDDLYPARAAARGTGRQPMNPTQLASAVRQPNWWPV